MIHQTSTVLKKYYNKPMTRVGIESVRVGDYVRAVDINTGDYLMTKIESIVKLTLPSWKITTSCFDELTVTSGCRFLSLDGLKPWTPSDSFDYSTRLLKRDSTKLLTPFIKSSKLIGTPSTFYDVLLEDKNAALLVDGYARIYN